jgi:nucleoid-associated protein YgaU
VTHTTPRPTVARHVEPADPGTTAARWLSERSYEPEDAMATEPTNITPAGKTYTVVKGDSLSKIARREYGDANKWRKIFEANKDVIDDPDLIEVGQDLIIPE